MPRYRFRWEVVPADILDELGAGLHLDGDVIVQLRRRYGARPTTQFIREAWPILREGWLRRDDALRVWVVGELREAGLGDPKLGEDHPYLQSCRNAETLRRVALLAFCVLGEGDPQAPNEPPPATEALPEHAGAARRSGGEFDLDSAIESAWGAFTDRLHALIAGIEPFGSLILGLPTAIELADLTGAAPYVQVLAHGENALRGEVSGNAFLDPRLHLSEAQQRTLTAIGWNRPTAAVDESGAESANFGVDLPHSAASRLADMTVATIRAVFDVPHPSFLEIAGAPEPEIDDQPDGPSPKGPDDLRRRVEALLAERFDAPVLRDADGDIPIRSGSAMVFVRISPELPVVELFSPLLLGVSGDALALERLNRTNRGLRFARLTWTRGTVLANHEFWSDPFVPELFMRAIDMMMELADDLDDSLRPELGGRRFFEDTEAPAPEPSADSEQMHPALLTITALTPDGTGLTAAEVAKICGCDRDLVLRLITDADGQALEWEKSASDADDSAEAEECRSTARSWEATATLLRAALRDIVLG
ncbi:MAG: T3SS (YopN, CesT) and YbjN peptide-binding chaperone 1 [Sporichthyaceae bacterium]